VGRLDKTSGRHQIYMLEAARAGHENRLFALDPSLVNVRTTDWHQQTPLHLAAENGHDKIVARLLEHNPALIDAVTSRNKMTALQRPPIDGDAAAESQSWLARLEECARPDCVAHRSFERSRPGRCTATCFQSSVKRCERL